MRTTVTLDPDVYAAVESRRSSGGLSAVINDLIRAGLAAKPVQAAFVQAASPMKSRIDVRNIGDVLESIDGPGAP